MRKKPLRAPRKRAPSGAPPKDLALGLPSPVWLTRDSSAGTLSGVVDAWSTRPTRHADADGVTWFVFEGTLARFVLADALLLIGTVPNTDMECVRHGG